MVHYRAMVHYGATVHYRALVSVSEVERMLHLSKSSGISQANLTTSYKTIYGVLSMTIWQFSSPLPPRVPRLEVENAELQETGAAPEDHESGQREGDGGEERLAAAPPPSRDKPSPEYHNNDIYISRREENGLLERGDSV